MTTEKDMEQVQGNPIDEIIESVVAKLCDGDSVVGVKRDEVRNIIMDLVATTGAIGMVEGHLRDRAEVADIAETTLFVATRSQPEWKGPVKRMFEEYQKRWSDLNDED